MLCFDFPWPNFSPLNIHLCFHSIFWCLTWGLTTSGKTSHTRTHTCKCNTSRHTHRYKHTNHPCHITCTFKIYLCAFGSTYRYDIQKRESVLLNWKLGTHLILVYFLCCCIVTAPKEGASDWGQRDKGQEERERAEVVVIWDQAGCSFDMLEMRSCLYNSQKHCQEPCHTTLCTLSCCWEMAASPALPLSSLTVHYIIPQVIFTLINALTSHNTVRLEH